MCLFT